MSVQQVLFCRMKLSFASSKAKLLCQRQKCCCYLALGSSYEHLWTMHGWATSKRLAFSSLRSVFNLCVFCILVC